MIEALALAAGIVSGIGLSFVPGVPLTLILALLLVLGLPKLVGVAAATCFVASAAGAGVYARRLGAVYHPSAGAGGAASVDVSLRLTADRRGADALRLMVLGTDLAWIPVLLLAVVVAVAAISAQANAAAELERVISYAGVPVIIWWVAHTCWKSHDTAGTALGFGLMALFGYACMHAPALTGGEHQMAVLMGAVFGVPITLSLLAERGDGAILRDQLPPSRGLLVSFQPGIFGAVLGCVCGFLAGLGAGSLVSMAESATDSDESYLLMASAGEAANDLLALLLIVLAGVGRSGEAVLLGRVAGRLDIMAGLLVFVAVAAGAYAGRLAVFKYEHRYRQAIAGVNPVVPAAIVLVLIIGQASLTGFVVASVAFLVSGTCISLWARERKLPVQVSFGALAIPVALQSLGLVPTLNSLLF